MWHFRTEAEGFCHTHIAKGFCNSHSPKGYGGGHVALWDRG